MLMEGDRLYKLGSEEAVQGFASIIVRGAGEHRDAEGNPVKGVEDLGKLDAVGTMPELGVEPPEGVEVVGVWRLRADQPAAIETDGH